MNKIENDQTAVIRNKDLAIEHCANSIRLTGVRQQIGISLSKKCLAFCALSKDISGLYLTSVKISKKRKL